MTGIAIRVASASPCAFGDSAGSMVSCPHSIRYDGGQRGWPPNTPWQARLTSHDRTPILDSLRLERQNRGRYRQRRLCTRWRLLRGWPAPRRRAARTDPLTPMTDIAIRADNLSKLYHIGALQRRHDTPSAALRTSLRDALTGFLPRISRIGRNQKENSSNSPNSRQASPSDELWALRAVSFEA